MTSNQSDTSLAVGKSAPQATSPSKSGLVRLVVLLGVLILLIGAYAYDYFVARSACEAMDKKLHEFVDERNKMGVKEADLVAGPDIQKMIGWGPTKVEDHDEDGYTIEYYCWWGHVPVINMRRHFIAVVYLGKKPRHYSSHHRELPPPEALPIVAAIPPADGKEGALPLPDNAGPSKDAPGNETAPATQPEKSGENPPPGNDKPAEGKPAEAKPAEGNPA